MKVGDKVFLRNVGVSSAFKYTGVGVIVNKTEGAKYPYRVRWADGESYPYAEDELVSVERWVPDSKKESNKPTGGPSSYYDLPFNEWKTSNDMIEHLADPRWGKFSPGLKDIFKAIVRWGDKDGTTQEYDANKIIYYGCRVLRQIGGNKAVRKALEDLLDNQQFKD